MSDNKIRVETKRLMAYPLNEDIPDQYELYKCEHCREEYLTQGEIDYETLWCPIHANFDYCHKCEQSFDKNEMQIDTDDSYVCNDCNVPICIECGEPLDKEEDARFCSQRCYTDYWADMDEDEHKNY